MCKRRKKKLDCDFVENTFFNCLSQLDMFFLLHIVRIIHQNIQNLDTSNLRFLIAGHLFALLSHFSLFIALYDVFMDIYFLQKYFILAVYSWYFINTLSWEL